MTLTRHASPLLDDHYIETRLSSGLTLLVYPKPGMQKKIAIYSSRYGSIDNDFSRDGKTFRMPHGIAHFLEHQMFKKEAGDLLVEFSKKGANSNAFTEYSTTSYYFSCIDNFEANLDTLTGLVFDPCFKDVWVEKEKLIIEQELRMYHDMPEARIYQNLQESLYSAHPARIDIGGTVESVKAIQRSELEECWRTFYAPANMTLIIAGDVDPAAIAARVEASVSARKLVSPKKLRRSYAKEPAAIARPRSSEAMQVGRPKLLMAWKETQPPAAGRALVLREVELNLAIDAMLGKGSALYGKLYSSALLDDSFSAQYSTTPTFGATVMGGETDEPEKLEAALIAGVKKFLKDGVRGRDLDRIKRKYLGSFLRAFDAVEQSAFALLRFRWKDFPVFDLPKLVKHVSASGILKAAKRHFGEGNRVVSLVVPKGETAG